MQNAASILLTPPGSAAIAVVRISGTNLSDFFQRYFSRPLVSGRAVHGELRDGDRVIDDPVVVLHESGSAADINLHGGPWVVAAFLEICRREGFEVVESVDGVLPELAVDAHDQIETLMLRHLPLAKTEQAVRALLAQPVLWRELDVNSASREVLERMAGDASLWWMLHPPRVAIVGTPNVGKSTLANQLFAQERSITADVPGTTRDWVGDIANLDGLAVMLVDTPGVRATSDAIEAEAIERSREVVRGADAIVVVLDASAEDETEQISLLEQYNSGTGCRPVLNRFLHGLAARATNSETEPNVICVMNKSDRAQPWSKNIHNAIATVATAGQDVAALRRAIRERFGCETFEPNHACWWTKDQLEKLRARLQSM